jgi:hypothetical protein
MIATTRLVVSSHDQDRAQPANRANSLGEQPVTRVNAVLNALAD